MDAEVHALQFKLGMAYILGEDQLCLGVKHVLLVVLLNVIDDGDTGKHAYNLALGVEHLPDDQERKQIEMKRADFNHSCLFCNAKTFTTFIAWSAGTRVRSSTSAEQRPAFRFSRSNRVEQSEAPENVELRWRARTVFLGHALQYGQVHQHFRQVNPFCIV